MPGSRRCREVFGACNKIKVFLSFGLGVKVMGLTNIFAFRGLSRQTGHAVEEFLWRFPNLSLKLAAICLACSLLIPQRRDIARLCEL